MRSEANWTIPFLSACCLFFNLVKGQSGTEPLCAWGLCILKDGANTSFCSERPVHRESNNKASPVLARAPPQGSLVSAVELAASGGVLQGQPQPFALPTASCRGPSSPRCWLLGGDTLCTRPSQWNCTVVRATYRHYLSRWKNQEFVFRKRWLALNWNDRTELRPYQPLCHEQSRGNDWQTWPERLQVAHEKGHAGALRFLQHR